MVPGHNEDAFSRAMAFRSQRFQPLLRRLVFVRVSLVCNVATDEDCIDVPTIAAQVDDVVLKDGPKWAVRISRRLQAIRLSEMDVRQVKDTHRCILSVRNKWL
jgi:hypothetical protein